MWKIVIRGILIGLSTLASFTSVMHMGGSIEACRTAALITLVASQLIHVFECKSENGSLFSIHIFSNIKLIFAVIVSLTALVAAVVIPFMQGVFETVPLTNEQLFAAIGFSVIIPILSGIFGGKKK